MLVILADKDSNDHEVAPQTPYVDVVFYILQSNNIAEANYLSYVGKPLATMWAIVYFQPYIDGQHFTLVTDHQSLQWFMETNKLIGKFTKWVLLLQKYNFEVVHHVDITNLDADGFSRNQVFRMRI